MDDTKGLTEFLKRFYHEDIFIINEPVYQSPAVVSSDKVEEPVEPMQAKNERGNFSSKVLILVENTSTSICKDDELEFLKKVLEAVNLNVENVLIINVHRYGSAQIQELFRQRLPEKVISFGVCAENCGYEDINLYEPSYVDDITWLFADHLSGIQGDVNRKKILWKALKALFLSE